MAEVKVSRRQTKIGYVVSDRMDKTVVVAVKRRLFHPTYGKVLSKTSKFKVHDEKNECKVGDRVKIMETKPLSKSKRWMIKEIIEKAK
jgi:small subunit ribosomal protein S17